MKNIYSILLFLFISSAVAFAQDNCSNAVNATVGSSCSYTTFNLPGTLTQSSPLPTGCNVANLKDDAWLVFTAVGTSTTISYQNTSRDAALWIYSGTCAALTQLSCADAVAGTGIETIVQATTPGTTYYVRIGRMTGNNSANMAGQYCIYSVNDNCNEAFSLPVGAGCVYTAGDVAGSTLSAGAPAPSCVASAYQDVWYSFVATATTHTVQSQPSTNLNVGIQVLSGTCAGLTQVACQNAAGNGVLETLNLTGLTIGTTYYVRLIVVGAVAPSSTTFDICVSGGSTGACPAGLGTAGVDYFNAGNLSVNYTHSGQTTCGKGNTITAANVTIACGSSSYYGGEDVVYEFTPASSGTSTISVSSAGSWMGIMLYAGCPLSAGAVCVGTSQSSAGNQSMCVNLNAGTTYYLVIDSWPTPTCNPYSLSITAPSGAAAGTTCATAVPATLPYSATSQTTACFGNDYTNASTGSCATLYESGEDKVYALTVSGPTCVLISLTNASTTSIGFQVYNGCPGVAGTTCVGNAGGATFITATGNTLSSTVVLPAAGTYYVIVDTWSSPFNATYNISMTNNGSTPSNDLPCNAVPLSFNVYEPGDNACTGGTGEPATPGCWSSGALNTVWYSFVAPASGQAQITTLLGSLLNTQIAVYSGACGPGLALVANSCNDNWPSCGSSVNNASNVLLTGLTAGATYYVRVDGNASTTGSFSIMVIDPSTTSLPVVQGMDCSAPNPVCAQNMAISDPGYSGYGNYCDFTGASICLASGERNVVWYTLPINAAGNLVFDLVPNDFSCAAESETDYDYAVWKITGAGATSCALIATGAVPLRCNYSGLGVTGMWTAGNAPGSGGLSASVCPTCTPCAPYSPSPTYDVAYEAPLAVVAGEVYVLAVSNFSNSTSGFRIDFKTSPIGYSSAASTSVTWSGGGGSGNQSSNLPANWGGCAAPTCTRSAVVAPFTWQPVVQVNDTVNDLTIQPGASLTINAGIELVICGNFTNNGTLTMLAGSTIKFNNGATHQMVGNFTGTNKIWNLTISQTGGSVVLNSNIDLAGNLNITNATSILNTNGNYVKIAGNFVNFGGDATYTNVGTTGTLEFNGTAAQTFNQGNAVLNLQNIVMNHTGPGVTLLTNMYAKTNTGLLTLTAGRIITNAFEVQILNTANGACTVGNTTSFVEGNLRRFLNGAATGAFEFPVGSPTTGYQRATIDFTSATAIPQLLARFDNYAPPMGPAANECPNNTYNTLPLFNNGYWTISASANPTSGFYTTTLYPTNVTNNSGLGWTVVKGASTSTFLLDGTCAASTAAQVIRTGMNGFSVFGVAQSTSPLPVEFISFTGVALEEKNQLSWSTASETNNQYFYIERSEDGINFSVIGRKDGNGTTSQIHHYAFDDFNPLEGTNYYRLKQVDYNGSFMYSNIIALDFHRGKMNVVNVKPNPTNGEVNFDFHSPVETQIHILMTDVTGRVVKDQYIAVTPGTTFVNTAIDETGAGVYTMIITEEKYGFRSVTRLVKY